MSFAALSIADMTILAIPPDKPDKIRHDWTTAEAREIIAAPLNDLVHTAQTFHRNHFDANEVQVSTLLSIKTGGCPEDCSYCSQSAHNEADDGSHSTICFRTNTFLLTRANSSRLKPMAVF